MTVAGSRSGVVSDCDSRVGVGLSGWMLFAKLQAGKRLRGAPALELGPTYQGVGGWSGGAADSLGRLSTFQADPPLKLTANGQRLSRKSCRSRGTVKSFLSSFVVQISSDWWLPRICDEARLNALG